MSTSDEYAGHTPGPWWSEPCTHGGVIVRRGGDDVRHHPQTHLQVVPTEDGILMAAAPDLLARVRQLEAERDAALDALAEIAKGEGPFNRDPLTHAGNCIDAMKGIATDVLRAAGRLPA